MTGLLTDRVENRALDLLVSHPEWHTAGLIGEFDDDSPGLEDLIEILLCEPGMSKLGSFVLVLEVQLNWEAIEADAGVPAVVGFCDVVAVVPEIRLIQTPGWVEDDGIEGVLGVVVGEFSDVHVSVCIPVWMVVVPHDLATPRVREVGRSGCQRTRTKPD